MLFSHYYRKVVISPHAARLYSKTFLIIGPLEKGGDGFVEGNSDN